MAVQIEERVRVVVESVEGNRIAVRLPGTNYRVQLCIQGGEALPTTGQRVKGIIEAQGLRIHAALGGGRFIEPVWGEPRIVAGRLLKVDEAGGRVLVDVAVPIWITLPDGQDLAVLRQGELVNCYLQSGATFTVSA